MSGAVSGHSTMNLEGLEMIAVLVVVVAFVKVLEQFGLLEPSYDGKIREDFFKLFTLGTESVV